MTLGVRLFRHAIAPLLTAAALGACSRVHANSGPSPDTWHELLGAAQHQAAGGRFDAADSLLAGFARRYPGTSQALETTYWRGVFNLDPANPHMSLTTAMAELDAYLADARPREHVTEAASIRRIAGTLEGLNRSATLALAQARDLSGKVQSADARPDAPKPTDPAASADEVKRLKDELAKANAELERIRRRLAQPPPKPPL